MPSIRGLLVAAIASMATHAAAQDKKVFAHHIIGVSAWMTQQDWQQQIALAASAGIDGFALNIAKDSYTDTQLGYAYDAAAKHGNFKMFISFDYAAAKSQGGFGAAEVASKVNQYKSKPAQYFYSSGKPLVSTFEGPEAQGDWGSIKSQTGAFFMPDWSSLGPQSAAASSVTDGLLSWDAWPDGATDMPTSASTYKSQLDQRGKAFMMPVSPWFYTNIPSSKNWLWRGNQLWPKSWQLAQQLQPALVEILTWNDFGESSYIGPNARDTSAYPPNVGSYVTPSNHTAWLADLPYYIAAYKGNGAPAASAYKPHITFWHRLSPGSACASTNTPCNAPYQNTHPAAGDCDTDAIFFTAFAPPGQKASFSVSMGGTTRSFTADTTGAWSGSVPFSAFAGLGPVTVQGNGLGSATGKAISKQCTAGWNAFVATTA